MIEFLLFLIVVVLVVMVFQIAQLRDDLTKLANSEVNHKAKAEGLQVVMREMILRPVRDEHPLRVVR